MPPDAPHMERPDLTMVLNWYHSLFSRRVNLISDYAGNELFVIELDSLLLHCFSDPKIDFRSESSFTRII